MVTGSRGVDALLHSRRLAGTNVKAAVASGIIYAEKIEGVWAYGSDGDSIPVAREKLARAAESVCHDWLLVPAPIAAGAARKRLTSPDVEFRVAQALVREFVRNERVAALPLFTEDYLPYFALYAHDDQDEIDRYVGILLEWTVGGGDYEGDDLPNPLRPRDNEAWRERVLAHGEFLGLGTYGDRSYSAHGFIR
jgi:hypothetical protein